MGIQWDLIEHSLTMGMQWTDEGLMGETASPLGSSMGVQFKKWASPSLA